MKVEKGIDIPPSGAGRISAYPFKGMEVGDSFLVPYDGEEPRAVLLRVSSSCGARKRNHGEQYSCRSLEDGVRVWRIK